MGWYTTLKGAALRTAPNGTLLSQEVGVPKCRVPWWGSRVTITVMASPSMSVAGRVMVTGEKSPRGRLCVQTAPAAAHPTGCWFWWEDAICRVRDAEIWKQEELTPSVTVVVTVSVLTWRTSVVP